MPSRTFSESDTRDVLARAARLQEQGQASGMAGGGGTPWLRRWARTRADPFSTILNRAELLVVEGARAEGTSPKSGRAEACLTLSDESLAGDTPDERGAPGHNPLLLITRRAGPSAGATPAMRGP